jgi:hypothetical protein
LPPVSPPFHANAILPEGNMFCQEPLTQVCGKRFSIATGIGKEMKTRGDSARLMVPAGIEFLSTKSHRLLVAHSDCNSSISY